LISDNSVATIVDAESVPTTASIPLVLSYPVDNIDWSAHLAIVWQSSTRPIEHLSPKHCHLTNINQLFLAPILTCVSSFENSTSFYSSRCVFPSVPADHIASQCQSWLCTRILYLLEGGHHEGHIIPLWHKNRGLLWNHHESGQHGQNKACQNLTLRRCPSETKAC